MPVTFQVVGNLADFGNDPRADVLVRAHATPAIKVGDVAVHSNEPEAVKTDGSGAFTLTLVSLPGVWYRIHTPYSGAIRTVNLAGYVPNVDDPTTGEAFPDGTVVDLVDVVDEDPTPGYEAVVYGGNATWETLAGKPALGTAAATDSADYATAAQGAKADAALTPAAADTAYAIKEGGYLKGTSGKRYRVVACALRNTGAPNYWQPIDDAGHSPLGVASVTSGTADSLVTITHDFTATKVVSMTVVGDEVMAAQGYVPGASAGLTQTLITIPKPVQGIASKVYWTGSAWSYFGSTATGITYTAGKLRFTHASIGDLGATVALTNGSAPSALPYYVILGALSATTTEVWFVDRTTGGAYLGAVDTQMQVIVTRNNVPGYYGNVRNLTDAGANLWVHGVFEVA